MSNWTIEHWAKLLSLALSAAGLFAGCDAVL